MVNHLKRRFSGSTLVMLVILIVVTAVTLLPFISIFLASFRPGREIMRQGLGLNLDIRTMNLDNYKLLFSAENQGYFLYFMNSLKLTFLQTAPPLLDPGPPQPSATTWSPRPARQDPAPGRPSARGPLSAADWLPSAPADTD